MIPEFQNPTGHLMPVELRERLVAAAHAAGTDLVVDESFVDLPLDGTPMPPPVAVFDRHSRVISIGGMSKAVLGWPAHRLGPRLRADRCSGWPPPGSASTWPARCSTSWSRCSCSTGRTTIVPARRVQLAAQRDALLAALGEQLPEWRIRVPSGGVTLWAELDGPISSALARAAEEVGVRLAPGPRFGLDGTLERFLRLPFTLPAADLVDAVKRIAAVRYDLDRATRPEWRKPAVIA